MFNEQKTKFMLVSRKKPHPVGEINVYLNNKLLQKEEQLTYLGVIIDR
jgi:hypothetical protein